MNLYVRDSILGLLLLLATVPLSMSAQEDVQNSITPVMHEQGDWTLSISPLYAYHPEAHPRIAGELDAGLFLGKYVSVNANFAAGQGYIQMGLGIIGIPLMALSSGYGISGETFEDFLLKLAVIALSFENLNFHIPVNDHIEISPYISLLRFKYIEEGYGRGQDTNVNFVAGSRLNIFVTDRFFISPFAETTRDWGTNGRWGVNGGIQFGFYFYNK